MEYRFYNLSPAECFLERKKPPLNGSKISRPKKSAGRADNFKLARPIKISPFDFKRKLKKALSGNYNGLLFGESFLENKNFDFYLRESLKNRLKCALQISAPRFKGQKERLSALKKKLAGDLFLNIVFEDIQELDLKAIKAFFPNVFFAYVVSKQNKKKPVRRKWPKEIFKKTEFYFPYKKSFFDPFLTPRQVYKFIKKQGPVRPGQNEIYDSRIAPDMDLEPVTLPFAENKIPPLRGYSQTSLAKSENSAPAGKSQAPIAESGPPRGTKQTAGSSRSALPADKKQKESLPADKQNKNMDIERRPARDNSAREFYIKSASRPLFSIIIPSYNSKTQVINSLKNLALQNFPRNEYEIILVDDGSEDNTRSAIRSFMRECPSLNFKAIHFPRALEKNASEGRFRAGLARNLGAKHSAGEILAFLDADILSPPDYLKRLSLDHQKADLVLLKRYHLKEGAPLDDLFFENEKIKKWRYIEEKNYWGNFYKTGFSGVRAPWKYVCSYGLSLPKKDFWQAGAFGKNFVFYGFEDTDLGYRLFKRAKKFLLSDIEVYHQAPFRAKNSFHNPMSRQIQLSKTAKIFFYKHLDPEIYEEMKSYMAQKRGLSYFLPFSSAKRA